MAQTEKTIFEKEGLKITDMEVMYDYTLYPVADITAVEVKKRSGSPAGGITLLVLGGLVLLFVIGTEGFGSGCECIPSLMVLGGAVMAATGDSFQIRIHRGEKVNAIFTTKKEELAREIEAALNTVLSKKS